MASTDRVAKLSSPSPGTSVFSESAKAHVEGLARAHNELFDKFSQSGQKWADRLQEEVHLFTELGTKLTAARSIPEVAAAYQSYADHRVEKAGEDAKRLMEDGQAFLESGARLWFNNWSRDASS